MKLKQHITHTINVPIQVDDEAIDNILWGAVNQGSTYWLHSVEVTREGSNGINAEDGTPTIFGQIQTGGELTFEAPEDDSDTTFERYTLTLENFLEGLSKYLLEFPNCIEDGQIETCNIDSGMCDLILQYALFEEQIYG